MTDEDLPHGPHRIAVNGQVVIPKDVLRRAQISPGEKVYVVARSGVVELFSASRMASWYRRGRTEADPPTT